MFLRGFEDDRGMLLATRRHDHDIGDRWDIFEFFLDFCFDGEVGRTISKEDTPCIVAIPTSYDKGSAEL